MVFPLQIRPTWAEVNLDNLEHNIREFRRCISSRTAIMAVVKANAYGHGAIEVSRVAQEQGVSFFGAAVLEEGIALRRAGIKKPILLFRHVPLEQGDELLKFNLTAAVFTMDAAEAFSAKGAACGKKIPVHIKVDTGMGCVGVQPRDALAFIRRVDLLPGLKIDGLFTHFAAADEADKSYAYDQFRLFQEVAAACRASGIKINLHHTANTAATIDLPETHLDMVRVGIGLHGCYPSSDVNHEKVKLRPVLSFKTKIIHLKKVPPGSAISYGCTYRAPEEALIATLTAGYGDGYPRILSNRGEVLVRGRRVPVVGRVCMDQMMLRVDAVPEARVGDDVVIYGEQDGETVSVDEIAALTGTINYEILCAVDKKRVPRVYFQKGEVVGVRDILDG